MRRSLRKNRRVTHKLAVGSKAHFHWLLPCYAGISAALFSLPFILLDGKDILHMLYVFILVPIASLGFALFLLVAAIRNKKTPRLSLLLVLPVFWAVTWIQFMNSFQLRSAARWTFAASNYEAEVLAQPIPKNGELRHIGWDGWGFVGEDTVAYLVFDPHDALVNPLLSRPPGKFPGIPCAVYRIHRLEAHWFTVLFYTNSNWDHCN